MGKRKVKYKPNTTIEPCPNCNNNTESKEKTMELGQLSFKIDTWSYFKSVKLLKDNYRVIKLLMPKEHFNLEYANILDYERDERGYNSMLNHSSLPCSIICKLLSFTHHYERTYLWFELNKLVCYNLTAKQLVKEYTTMCRATNLKITHKYLREVLDNHFRHLVNL